MVKITRRDLYDIIQSSRRIEDYCRYITELMALKDCGFTQDIIDTDGPLFEDDTGDVDGRIAFYQAVIDDAAKAIREISNR